MAQKTIFICDICNRDFKDGERRYTIVVPQENNYNDSVDDEVTLRPSYEYVLDPKSNVDVCKSCKENAEEFFKKLKINLRFE